jgi:hypothetical protein
MNCGWGGDVEGRVEREVQQACSVCGGQGRNKKRQRICTGKARVGLVGRGAGLSLTTGLSSRKATLRRGGGVEVLAPTGTVEWLLGSTSNGWAWRLQVLERCGECALAAGGSVVGARLNVANGLSRHTKTPPWARLPRTLWQLSIVLPASSARLAVGGGGGGGQHCRACVGWGAR